MSRAFKHLVQDGMINEPEPSTAGFLIIICNYDYYQNPLNFKAHMKDGRTQTRMQTRTQTELLSGNQVRQEFEFCHESMNENMNNNRKESGSQLINNNVNNDNKNIDSALVIYTEEQRIGFEGFTIWIATNAPSVAKMKEPFTIDQYIKLKAEIGWKKIADFLESMEIWEGLKKRTSAYKTLLTFKKREQERTAKNS